MPHERAGLTEDNPQLLLQEPRSPIVKNKGKPLALQSGTFSGMGGSQDVSCFVLFCFWQHAFWSQTFSPLPASTTYLVS